MTPETKRILLRLLECERDQLQARWSEAREARHRLRGHDAPSEEAAMQVIQDRMPLLDAAMAELDALGAAPALASEPGAAPPRILPRGLSQEEGERLAAQWAAAAGDTGQVAVFLSRRDAAALRTAARFAEGDPAEPRGAFNRISAQLEAQGVSLIVSGGPLFSAIVLDCKPEWPAQGGAA